MNLLDFFIISALGIFIVRGYLRGLLLEIAAIVALIAGYFGANSFYPSILPTANRFFESPSSARVAAYFAAFFIIYIVLNFAFRFLRSARSFSTMGPIEKIFGAIVGFAKGMVMALIVIYILATFLPRDSKFLSESKLVPQVLSSTKILAERLPKQFQGQYRKIQKRLSIKEKPKESH